MCECVKHHRKSTLTTWHSIKLLAKWEETHVSELMVEPKSVAFGCGGGLNFVVEHLHFLLPPGSPEAAGGRVSRQHRGRRPAAADQTAAGRLLPAVLQHGGELRVTPTCALSLLVSLVCRSNGGFCLSQMKNWSFSERLCSRRHPTFFSRQIAHVCCWDVKENSVTADICG